MIKTIFALASAPGRAGVAVYRISGPRAAQTFEILTHTAVPKPRQVRVTLYVEGGEKLMTASPYGSLPLRALQVKTLLVNKRIASKAHSQSN